MSYIRRFPLCSLPHRTSMRIFHCIKRSAQVGVPTGGALNFVLRISDKRGLREGLNCAQLPVNGGKSSDAAECCVEGGKKNVSAALRNTLPSLGPERQTVTDAERRAASFDAARRGRNLLVDRDGP